MLRSSVPDRSALTKVEVSDFLALRTLIRDTWDLPRPVRLIVTHLLQIGDSEVKQVVISGAIPDILGEHLRRRIDRNGLAIHSGIIAIA